MVVFLAIVLIGTFVLQNLTQKTAMLQRTGIWRGFYMRAEVPMPNYVCMHAGGLNY